ncbi:AAA family ATPase [Aquitalea pelogenes]|uniref:AAA family ATPase n=1 Tax=Aquitalea pelogenes TaxID=1293573 RepID=UPI0035B2145E
MTISSIEVENFSIGFDNLSSEFSTLDGMALVIGKNGSGKTNLMHKICIGKANIWQGFNLINEEIGIIYYSCTPTQIPSKIQNNFINCKSIGLGKISEKIYESISDTFELTQSRTYTSNASQIFYKKTVLKHLASRCIDILLKSNIDTGLYKFIVKTLNLNEYELSNKDSISNVEFDHLENEIILRYYNFANKIEKSDYMIKLVALEQTYKTTPLHERENLLDYFFYEIFRHEIGSNIMMVDITLPDLNNAIKTITRLFYLFNGEIDNWSVVLHPKEDYQTNEILASGLGFTLKPAFLPSGLQQLSTQLGKLQIAARRLKRKGYQNLLFLIDEGDSFLHMDWQLKYIKFIEFFLTKTKSNLELESISIVISTHSPVIASEFTRDAILSLDYPVTSPTLAAPIEMLMQHTFGNTSLGLKSIDLINKIKTNQDNANRLLGEIGDPILSRILSKEYKNDN